jgi:hypothetical protein
MEKKRDQKHSYKKHRSKKRRKNYSSGGHDRNKEIDYPNCPLCGRSVRNLNIAIEDKTSHEPAHFECIIKHIAESTQLGQNERIHYLGSGCFGIIKYEEGKGLASFSVKKRIQYEDTIKKPDWRKKLCRTDRA